MKAEDLFTPLSSFLQEKGTPWWEGMTFTPFLGGDAKFKLFGRTYKTRRGTFMRVRVEEDGRREV